MDILNERIPPDKISETICIMSNYTPFYIYYEVCYKADRKGRHFTS